MSSWNAGATTSSSSSKTMASDSMPLREAERTASAWRECTNARRSSAPCWKSNRRPAVVRPSSCGWPPVPQQPLPPTMRKAGAPLRIMLADDHVTVRHGLKLIIEGQTDMKVVCEASDGNAAIREALALHPDVI